MSLRRLAGAVLAVIALWALGLGPAPHASAHVVAKADDLRLEMGWGREPAHTGAENFVQVTVTDAAGAPVTGFRDPLAAEVSFGGERVVLSLVPGGKPGELRAPLVPTRAGVYSFRVTGRVHGTAVDRSASCSERTFDCVADASDVQFPAQEPTSGQVAQKLARTIPRAERTADEVAAARTLAAAALGAAALALALASAGAVVLRRRTVRESG